MGEGGNDPTTIGADGARCTATLAGCGPWRAESIVSRDSCESHTRDEHRANRDTCVDDEQAADSLTKKARTTTIPKILEVEAKAQVEWLKEAPGFPLTLSSTLIFAKGEHA